jgi:transmembrane sensor
MADLLERLSDAKGHVGPNWSPDRERAVRLRIEAGVARRAPRRALVLSAAALAVAVVVLVLRHGSVFEPRETPIASADSRPTELLRLDDGSNVTSKSGGAHVAALEVAPNVVALRLDTGSARFSVTHNPARVFRVTARNVTVTVLGTIFTVSLEPKGVHVAVERGRVHVASPLGERDVSVGEDAVVPDAPEIVGVPAASIAAPPPDEAEAPDVPAPSEVRLPMPSTPSAPSTVPAPSNPPRTSSWRELAEDGDYASAYKMMTAKGAPAVRDEPGDLLLAADVARLGGHPEAAVAAFQRVLVAHSSDSRAPLAAFTFGRTLLDQLGEPHDAAEAFATARRLDPGGALAQDALAREVESWSRAGETSRARERAEDYFRLYPKGRRAAAVRRLGGLD